MLFCHSKATEKTLYIYVELQEKEKQEQVDCLGSSQFSTLNFYNIILIVLILL